MSIADKLTYTAQGVADAWTACEAKGAIVPPVLPTGGRDIGLLDNSIMSIEQGDGSWFYPADWVAEPDMPADPGVAAVYKIFPTQETVSFYVNTNSTSGSVVVDWGDGTVETVPRYQIQHTYDFDTLVSPITTDGNKTVVVKISATPGYIATAVQLARTGGVNYNNLLLVKANCTGMTTMSQFMGAAVVDGTNRNASIAEAVFLTNMPTTATWPQAFSNCLSLRVFDTGDEPITANNMGTMLQGTTMLDGYIKLNYTGTGNYTYSSFGTTYSSMDGLKVINTTPTSTYGTAYILSTNLYCTELDMTEFLSQITPAEFIFTNAVGRGLLHTIKLNWDSFKTTANQSLKFTDARLFKTLETVGTMGTNVTGIDVSGTNAGAEFLETIIPELLDRTGLSAGTLNLSYSPATDLITPAQIAAITSKNWNITR